MAQKLTPEEKAQIDKVFKPESALKRTVRSVSEGVRQFNMGVLDPLGGAALVSQGAGTDLPTTPAMGAARMTGQAAGTAASLLVPGLGFANAARVAPAAAPVMRLGPAVRSFLGETAESAIRKPGAFWSMELLPAVAAGAASATVAQETDSPIAIMAAELVAGGAAAAAPGMLSSYTKVSPVVGLAQNVWRAFTQGDAASGVNARRASARLQEVEPNARQALVRANEAGTLPEAPLTLAELSESPGLLSLQRSVADATDKLSQANQARFAEVNRVAQDALRTLGDAPGGPINVEETRQFLNALMEERVRVARVAVDERLEAMGEGTSSGTASTMARLELDRAYRAAQDQEDELWGAVQLNEPSSVSNTLDAYSTVLRQIAGDRVEQAQGLIPARIEQMLGVVRVREDGRRVFSPGEFARNPPTMREMVSMRRELNDFMRAERAKDAPNRRAIQIANQLQEAILGDLANNPAANEQLAVARAYSRDMNERFRQGEVGSLLGFDVEGGLSVSPELTLERTLGLSGARGRVASNQLLNAVQRTGNTDAMRGYMQDFLRQEFTNATRKYGEFDPQAAARYVAQRREVLTLFPELRRDFNAAMVSGQEFRATSRMRDPDLAAAALVTARSPGTELDRVLSTPNPQQTARELRAVLGQDPTGRALAGMRRATADSLLGRSLMLNAADVTDQPFASGRKLYDQIGNPAIRSALAEIFEPEQMERLGQIAETLRVLDVSRAARPLQEGIIADKEALLFNFARRLGAATLGSKISQAAGSGGNIQIPSMVIKVTDELRKRGIDPARELIIDAITSPNQQLMRSMLLESGSVANNQERQRYVTRQLNAWAAAVAAKYAMSFTPAAQQYDRTRPYYDPSDIPQVR